MQRSGRLAKLDTWNPKKPSLKLCWGDLTANHSHQLRLAAPLFPCAAVAFTFNIIG